MEETLGMIGGQIGGAILGNVLNSGAREDQLEQQEKLMRQQIQGQKELTDYNRQQQMQMWRDTNYTAQIAEIKRAGLSPGLIYGKGGAGGASSSVAPGSISGGKAEHVTPLASMAMGQQLAAQAAAIENTKADTEAKRVAAAKDAANIGLITATTISQELENNYMQLTGYDNRGAMEAAQAYATDMKGRLDSLKIDQMPQELRNATNMVILEGQKVAIMAQDANTRREQLEVYQKIEQMRMDLQKNIQSRQIAHEKSEGQASRSSQEYQSNKSREMQAEQMKQNDEHFYVNQTMRVIENALQAVIPWYEPSETVTTNSTRFDANGDYQGEVSTKTTKSRR